MAPYGRQQAYEAASYQPQDRSAESAEQVIEIEMENSTTRALAIPLASGAVFEPVFSQDNDGTNPHGWPPSMQAAFDSYMPFNSEMPPLSQWPMRDPPGIFGGDQKVDAEAPPDYSYHWNTGATC